MTFALKTASYSKRRSLAHGIIGKYKDPEVEGYIQTLMKRINELESEVLGLRDQLKDREFRDLEHFTGSNEKTPRQPNFHGFTAEQGTADSKDKQAPLRAEEEVSSFINMNKHSRAPHQDELEDEEDCEQLQARYSAIAQRLEALSDEKFELIAQKRRECFKGKPLVSTPHFEMHQPEDSDMHHYGDQMLKEVLDSSGRFQGMMGLSTMPENFQSDASLSNLELVPHRFSNQFYEVSETERREVELIRQSEKGNWGRTSKFGAPAPDQDCDNSCESECDNFRLILRDSVPDFPNLVLKPSKESKNLSPMMASQDQQKSRRHLAEEPGAGPTKNLIYSRPVAQEHTFLKKESVCTLPSAVGSKAAATEGLVPSHERGNSSQLFSKGSSEQVQGGQNSPPGSDGSKRQDTGRDSNEESAYDRTGKAGLGSNQHLRTTETADSAADSPKVLGSKPSPIEDTATFAKATHGNTNINISFEEQEACQSPKLESSSRRGPAGKASETEDEEQPRASPIAAQLKLALGKLGKEVPLASNRTNKGLSPLCSERTNQRFTPVRHSMNDWQPSRTTKRVSQAREVETEVCFSQRESKEQSRSPGFGRLSSSRSNVLKERKTNQLAKSTAVLPGCQLAGKRSATPTARKKENAGELAADKTPLSGRATPIPSNVADTDKLERNLACDTARGEQKDSTNHKKKALVKKFSNISSQLRNLYTRKPLDSDCVFLDGRGKCKTSKQN